MVIAGGASRDLPDGDYHGSMDVVGEDDACSAASVGARGTEAAEVGRVAPLPVEVGSGSRSFSVISRTTWLIMSFQSSTAKRCFRLA